MREPALCDHLLATKNHSREWKFTHAIRVEHVQLILTRVARKIPVCNQNSL